MLVAFAFTIAFIFIAFSIAIHYVLACVYVCGVYVCEERK